MPNESRMSWSQEIKVATLEESKQDLQSVDRMIQHFTKAPIGPENDPQITQSIIESLEQFKQGIVARIKELEPKK